MNIPESADGNYASPPAGLYAPVPSFFKGEWAGDPDEAAAKRHFDRCAELCSCPHEHRWPEPV
jgi:hypothetical protein